jgi:hypothetical protein
MTDTHFTPPTCACGCGLQTRFWHGRWNKLYRGHSLHQYRKPLQSVGPMCACGCGQTTLFYRGRWSTIVRGHNWKTRTKPNTRGPLASGWKGGIRLFHSGKNGKNVYVMVPRPDKRRPNGGASYMFRSHTVMEAAIGRPLRRGEVVHHINRDTMDDSLENLQLLTGSDHTRLHAVEKRRAYA